MPQKLLRWLVGALHLAFWAATSFVFVCFLGSLRWLRPGANPSASDLVSLACTLVLALGLYTIFYVYDTFWGDREEEQRGQSR